MNTNKNVQISNLQVCRCLHDGCCKKNVQMFLICTFEICKSAHLLRIPVYNINNDLIFL
jgi:hypothetical protein